MAGFVESTGRARAHRFSKPPDLSIRLLAGLGVEGDAHAGATVKHRFQAARDPTQPNLCQVHLLHGELFGELETKGFSIEPGQIGENILTRGIDLLGLPLGAILCIGATAELRVTGLRDPCVQLDRFKPGLKAALIDRDLAGAPIRKAGIMAVVLIGGDVQIGDTIAIVLPPTPHRRLPPV